MWHYLVVYNSLWRWFCVVWWQKDYNSRRHSASGVAVAYENLGDAPGMDDATIGARAERKYNKHSPKREDMAVFSVSVRNTLVTSVTLEAPQGSK